MAQLIKTKRGLDIQIGGMAEKQMSGTKISEIIAVFPDHYHGITPIVVVKEGSVVKQSNRKHEFCFTRKR